MRITRCSGARRSVVSVIRTGYSANGGGEAGDGGGGGGLGDEGASGKVNCVDS